MTAPAISFLGNEISVQGHKWRVPYVIAQAVLAGNRVLVLYGYMTGIRDRQFQNFEAFTPDGVRLWIAEHPTSETADAYVRITSVTPLQASNFVGYDCTLDETNGKILEKKFTK